MFPGIPFRAEKEGAVDLIQRTPSGLQEVPHRKVFPTHLPFLIIVFCFWTHTASLNRFIDARLKAQP
jgi:hypothetical protein